MENQNEIFIQSVIEYHRAIATYRYFSALEAAKRAVENSPCDLEATRWSDIVLDLRKKTEKPTTKLLRSIGFPVKNG